MAEGADATTVVELQDGSTIRLRPVRSEDKSLFVTAIERLGPDSRYSRFLSPHGRLTGSELRYLTEIDHHEHEAIVALDARGRGGIGVARFIRKAGAPDTAEFAFAVVDEWQGRGVGTALLHRLMERARDEGISRITATVLRSNRPSIELMREIGRPQILTRSGGVEELVIDIPEAGLGDLGEALRRAAENMPRAQPGAREMVRAVDGRCRASRSPSHPVM
jgi:RimJ/RimL family protein N-acetyltransferase